MTALQGSASAEWGVRAATPLVLLGGGDGPTRAMLRFLLEEDGATVVETADVGALESLARRDGVALVVVIAPERAEDVFGSLSRLRTSGYARPTVLLARHVGTGARRRARLLGIQNVVELPARPRDLQNQLRSAFPPLPAGEPAGSGGRALVRAGGLTLRTAGGEVSDGSGWCVRLTRREAALLEALMLRPGQVVPRQELLEQVWSSDEAGTANGLAVLVRRLRRKLARPGGARPLIHAVHRHGYRFDARAVPRDSDQLAPSGQPHILVVEDDGATADMIGEVLRHAGYTVSTAVGPEAPVAARQTLPTLILLDINMPRMSGVDVRQELRASPLTAAIPVVALSAGHNLRLRADEMGADDYLPKPFSADDLVLRVQRWIGEAARYGPADPESSI